MKKEQSALPGTLLRFQHGGIIDSFWWSIGAMNMADHMFKKPLRLVV
ncbi:MAG: hypothetical protein ACI33P_03705 [Lysinibacillus sp.]